MDTNQPTASVPYSRPASPGIFGTRIPSTVTFAVGILLFLLPFAEIKCGDMTIANNTGLRVALGSGWQSVAGGMFDKKDVEQKTVSAEKQQKGQSQIYAIIGLGLGILGLLLSFANAKSAAGGAAVTGILSAGALIGMMIDLKKNFNASMANEAIDKTQDGADSLGLGGIQNSINNVKPTLHFTPWFYIAVVAFVAAALFCIMRARAKPSGY